MLPGLYKPKYKALTRIRIDVWANLKIKKLHKKKWRSLKAIVITNKKRIDSTSVRINNYFVHEVLRFPIYFRYKYQKDLVTRLRIRFIYGYIKHIEIKKIALKSKKKSYIKYIQKLEQTPISFLYRTKFVITYGEAKIHNTRKRIFINGKFCKTYINKGDLLHFNKNFENLLKRRWLNYYFSKTKITKLSTLVPIAHRRYKIYLGMYDFVDFDLNNFSFFFLNNITYFKNHPFRIPFEKVIRWYTRI